MPFAVLGEGQSGYWVLIKTFYNINYNIEYMFVQLYL